jgi:FlaA1/EpsC-like NDP-sugar epimerase
MTRYFMSIREAVQLVLQAATMSQGGDLYVLEMGQQVRIMDLARRMIRLAGRRIGDEIEIKVTGTRPGEKLVEELHSPDEHLESTTHPAISCLRPHNMPIAELDNVLTQLANATAAGLDDSVRAGLLGATARAVVPAGLAGGVRG